MSLSKIAPQEIWKHFSFINSVPRPSKKEEKIIALIKKFGEDLGLDTRVDKVGNVIIKKRAKEGMENRKTIVLQSHLDMVCQKNNDTEFDFNTMGIQMEVAGDWVKAKGTTLGADNGIGVAAIMAILESKSIEHPPIEALFTIDEETGMTGASYLEPNMLKGKILLNLDTEEDNEIGIGCAGGIDVTAKKSYKAHEKPLGEIFRIDVKGLRGGHSGMDIHKGFGNANVILARILFSTSENNKIKLHSIEGGGLRNAIPRESTALISVEDTEEFLTIYKVRSQEILTEFSSTEKDLSIEIQKASTEGNFLSIKDSETIINTLKALKNGVYKVSSEVEGLVETSNNVARILLEEGNLEIQCLARSSVESSKSDICDQLKSVFSLADINVEFSGSYPGWKPNPESKIIKIMEKVYEKKYGKKPLVMACHAGLECGIIGAHYPEMEMVSFGPTIKGAHSPEERVSILSVQKFWEYLKEILRQIPLEE
ncbi:MAG: aminoacyl-histidine dipeptidase [Bergeyella sp.]|nr:aminoacyl-histidine dipeptidase [Bergeyella sp.]